MVGKNAKANPTAVKRVAEISAEAGGSLIIANHSMTHTTPLPKQGVAGAISEIMNADAILSSSITRSQAGLPSERFFFRPPYGAFTSLGAANISRINEAGADKYTGPVFWDIGGELTDSYSADWACWGKVSVGRCTDGYIAEARTRGKGIILVHDVHAKTVDMLMGTGAANGRSLIKDLRNQGFKFVSLRAHEDVVQRTQDEQERLSASTQVSIDAQVTTAENGRVVVNVQIQNAAKAVARFDNVTSSSVEFRGNRTLDVTLPPGSHFVTITAYDAAGVAQGEREVQLRRSRDDRSEQRGRAQRRRRGVCELRPREGRPYPSPVPRQGRVRVARRGPPARGARLLPVQGRPPVDPQSAARGRRRVGHRFRADLRRRPERQEPARLRHGGRGRIHSHRDALFARNESP